MKTKHFKSRHALLMSLTSLMLCVSMLFGATFAWFTDSVTSGVNRIVSGNLDVELERQTNEGYTTVTETTSDLWQSPAFSGPSLWEPGAMAMETFRVTNAGSLALKYVFNINKLTDQYYSKVTWADDTTARDLTDVIKMVIANERPASRSAAEALFTTSAAKTISKTGDVALQTSALEPGASRTFTVLLYWAAGENTYDNKYNLNNTGWSLLSPANSTDAITAHDNVEDTKDYLYIEPSISLYATQQTSESDSFDNQYDANATQTVDGSDIWEGTVVATSTVMTAAFAANSTESLEITKSGVIESATVPAVAANAVFSEMANTAGGASNEMTMNLNVEKTGESTDETTSTTTVALEIDMTAVMKITIGENSTTTTKDVKTLDDYVTINYNLGTGKSNVVATHNGETMQKLDALDTTIENENGAYYYNEQTGILTIKTKSFSPFAVAYTVPVTGVTLDKTEMEIAAGNTGTLTATVLPTDATDKTVTWSSSETSVATVDANGIVTGVAAGEATITAKAGNVSATCTVTVSLPPVAIIGTVGYDSVQAAFNAAEDGDTIVLCQDVALSEGVTFNKNVTATFDMNSKKLSNANANINNLLTISNGNLSLKNGSIVNENEGQTTTINAVYLCGNASAAEISNINIRATGNGIYLCGSSSIDTMNATIYTYADTDGYSMFDAINLGEGCTIQEITGGTYDALLTSAYLESARPGTGSHSWNACHVLRVNGTINKISGGTFKGINPAVGYLIAINGSIGEISGGYFGYEEYSKDEPRDLFDDASKVNSISGGTFVSGIMINQTFGWDLLNGSKAQAFRNQLATGKMLLEKGTVEVKQYLSASEKTNTVNVYEVVDAE